MVARAALPLGTTVTQLERARLEVRDVESIREHYGLTLRRWVANLEADWPRAQRIAGPGRARVWLLYMAACALAFERNRIGVNQILAVRPPQSGASGLPRSPPSARRSSASTCSSSSERSS